MVPCPIHPRCRARGNWLLVVRHRNRGTLPGRRLRLHREGSREGAPKQMEWEGRLRPHDYTDLALYRSTGVAGEGRLEALEDANRPHPRSRRCGGRTRPLRGIRPGPLLTMVIRETLTGGWSAGARAASAPIFTDGPLIIVSVFLSGWVAEQPSILFLISLLGAGFLVWFGVDCFRIEPPDPEIAQEESRVLSGGV